MLKQTRLQGPFTYRDNTDFPGGWHLTNLAEVQAFILGPRRCLLEPTSQGTIFNYDFSDSIGQSFSVRKGPRGGIQIVRFDSDSGETHISPLKPHQ